METQKRNKIIISLLISFIILAGFGGYVYSQKVKHIKEGGPLMMILDKLTGELNLSDTQKEKVGVIKDEIKIKMESKKPDHKNEFEEFATAFKQDKLDKETMKEIIKKKDEQREEMKDFMMDELIKFHTLLTPEQRLKVVEKMNDFKDKFPMKHKPDSQ